MKTLWIKRYLLIILTPHTHLTKLTAKETIQYSNNSQQFDL